MKSIRTVSIVVNPNKPAATKELPRLRAWFKARGIKTVSAAALANADAVLTMGGDGTILAIAPKAAAARIPVLGVNTGRLGFMTAVDLGRMYQALERWLAGEWVVSERLMLAVKLPPSPTPHLALNDAVIRIGSTTRVTTVSASIGKEKLGYFTGDGVIVATPTGSTAYSLAAQGPIVHPGVEAMVLTPICAHSFRQRPVVFPAGKALQLVVEDRERRNQVQLCLDGQRVFRLKPGARVSVSRSPYKLQLLQDPAASYFGVLREKLSWGGR